MRNIHMLTALSVLAWLAFATDVSAANTGIVIEAVSDYSYYCGNSSCNTDAITEGQGFWNPMTNSGGRWTGTNFWSNGDVWDTDFYDAELTGGANDQGDTWFDVPGGGFSWVIGHGFCDDVNYGAMTQCTSDADCATVGGYCPQFGPLPQGASKVCIKNTKKTIITSSATNHHGNIVGYGGSAWQSIAWGEDAASGSFGGAGTNGGTNVFAITNSCGIRDAYWSQNTAYFYAGMHMLFMTMPVGAYRQGTEALPRFTDVNQWSARGSTLATNILANDNASAASSWINATISANSYIGYYGGTPSAGTTKFGAIVMLTADTNIDWVHWREFNETWLQARYDYNDSTSGNTLGIYYMCNYDCATYGIR